MVRLKRDISNVSLETAVRSPLKGDRWNQGSLGLPKANSVQKSLALLHFRELENNTQEVFSH